MYLWQIIAALVGTIYLVVAFFFILLTFIYDDFTEAPRDKNFFDNTIHYLAIIVFGLLWLPVLIIMFVADKIDEAKIRQQEQIRISYK